MWLSWHDSRHSNIDHPSMLRQMFTKLMEMGQRELVNYIPMIASKQKVNHKQCCASKSHPKLLQGFTAFKQKDSLQCNTTTVNVSCKIFEILRKNKQKASIFIFSFATFRREMLMNRGRVCYIGILFLFIFAILKVSTQREKRLENARNVYVRAKNLRLIWRVFVITEDSDKMKRNVIMMKMSPIFDFHKTKKNELWSTRELWRQVL